MLRRMIIALLCLLLPCLTLAETARPYEVYTFTGSLPQQLKEPLAVLIPDASCVLSGAAIQHNGDHLSMEQAHMDCYSALVLVQSGHSLHLYAVAHPEGQSWQVNDYTRFLRESSYPSVSIYWPEKERTPEFSLDYYTPDGKLSDTLCFYQLWQLTGHTNHTTGISIDVQYDSLVYTNAPLWQEYFLSAGFWMDYMGSIADFPTTQAEIEVIAANKEYAFIENAASSIVYSHGANLRREPTTSSESLGMYAYGVPMVYTGEKKQGAQWPWYQVRIGDTIGWMSGNYVSNQISGGALPVPLGLTVDGCLLYADPDSKQPLAQLEPGVTFHILTETKGMYHICIPSEVSWAVDPMGIYGYIPNDDVLQGAGIAALEAQIGK